MSIVVKLEFVFDTADEVVDLMDQLISPVPAGEMMQTQPQSAFQVRVERTDAQARPMMDMLTNALAQKG